MSEIISIHVGEAGLRVGQRCWELYYAEHGILKDGITDGATLQSNSPNAFFNKSESGAYAPRALFVDMEPTVIDDICVGDYKNEFQQVVGKEDSGSNYARGSISVGGNYCDLITNKIAKIAEACDNLQGFIIYHSVGGGTGSGTTSLVMRKLSELYPKKTRMEVSVYPSPKISTSVVEPYNAVLATRDSMLYADASFVLDNEAVYEMCKNKLGIEEPTYKNINNVMAQVVSTVTSSLRFESSINVSLSQMQTNLIPYPKMHFITSSLAPMTSSANDIESMTLNDVTNACFDRQLASANCDVKNGKFMSCNVMYKGDVTTGDVSSTIAELRKDQTLKLDEFGPDRLKTGICHGATKVLPDSGFADYKRSVCMMANNTGIT
uniref:tubulin alpha-1C chain-like n=1 Tax=Ciona intestinalis TaxID=7719 RepID=UPI000EF48A62